MVAACVLPAQDRAVSRSACLAACRRAAGAVAGDRGSHRERPLRGHAPGAAASRRRPPRARSPRRGLHGRRRTGRDTCLDLRDQLHPPRARQPGGAGRLSRVRLDPAHGAGGRERDDIPGLVGAHGALVVAASARRAPSQPGGQNRRSLVRSDDALRVRRDFARLRRACEPGRWRLVRGNARRGRGDVALGGVDGVPARPRRFWIERRVWCRCTCGCPGPIPRHPATCRR